MSRRSYVTNITPLPRHVTRDAALALLHDHVSMMKLNPLVIRTAPTDPPPQATDEEKESCVWYMVTDEMQYIPGTSAKSEMNYKAGFYDLPFGLQTHCFAPGGVDLKGMWSVKGNMPGEKPEPVELGSTVPAEGLYLREDVELRCNVLLTGFVKKNLKKSHAVLVKRLLERVEGEMAKQPQQQHVRQDSDLSQRSQREGDATPPAGTRSLPASRTPSVNVSAPSNNPIGIHVPPSEAEPCSCGPDGHAVMCPNYRYGAPIPRPRSPAPTPPASRDANPPVDTRWPPMAGQRPPSSSSQPQVNGRSLTSTLQTAKHVGPPVDQLRRHVIQPPIQQAKDNHHGRIVWSVGGGGNSPTVSYRSPQLLGEQAELPGSTVTTERDEEVDEEPDLPSYRSMTDNDSLYERQEDERERAYWQRGFGDLKMAPGDAGWI